MLNVDPNTGLARLGDKDKVAFHLLCGLVDELLQLQNELDIGAGEAVSRPPQRGQQPPANRLSETTEDCVDVIIVPLTRSSDLIHFLSDGLRDTSVGRVVDGLGDLLTFEGNIVDKACVDTEISERTGKEYIRDDDDGRSEFDKVPAYRSVGILKSWTPLEIESKVASAYPKFTEKCEVGR